MVMVGTIGLGTIPPWPQFADFLGEGLLRTRCPIGSQVYGLKSAVMRVLLEKYLYTQNVFNIYIKLQWFIIKMQCIFPINCLWNSVNFDRWTISVGQGVPEIPPPPPVTPPIRNLDFSLDLYWSQWPPKSASPGAEGRVMEFHDICPSLVGIFWQISWHVLSHLRMMRGLHGDGKNGIIIHHELYPSV